jgi:hypothetical protein
VGRTVFLVGELVFECEAAAEEGEAGGDAGDGVQEWSGVFGEGMEEATVHDEAGKVEGPLCVRSVRSSVDMNHPMIEAYQKDDGA